MGRPDFAALIPALAAAARAAGPPQIRNAGTLGGNIVTAAPTGDALPVLAALEATVILAGPDGRREVPVSHLLTGMDPLRPGEFLGLRARPAAARAADLPQGHRPHRPRPRDRLRRARRWTRHAAGALRGRRRRPDAAAPAGGRGVGGGAHRLGRRPQPGPEALTAFGEYVAAACIPDPPAAESNCRPPPYSLRRTVAALSRRALGRALS